MYEWLNGKRSYASWRFIYEHGFLRGQWWSIPTLTVTSSTYFQESQKRAIFWPCSDKLAISIGSWGVTHKNLFTISTMNIETHIGWFRKRLEIQITVELYTKACIDSYLTVDINVPTGLSEKRVKRYKSKLLTAVHAFLLHLAHNHPSEISWEGIP